MIKIEWDKTIGLGAGLAGIAGLVFAAFKFLFRPFWIWQHGVATKEILHEELETIKMLGTRLQAIERMQENAFRDLNDLKTDMKIFVDLAKTAPELASMMEHLHDAMGDLSLKFDDMAKDTKKVGEELAEMRGARKAEALLHEYRRP